MLGLLQLYEFSRADTFERCLKQKLSSRQPFRPFSKKIVHKLNFQTKTPTIRQPHSMHPESHHIKKRSPYFSRRNSHRFFSAHVNFWVTKIQRRFSAHLNPRVRSLLLTLSASVKGMERHHLYHQVGVTQKPI